MLNRKLFYNVAYIKFEGILNGVENDGGFLNKYKNLFTLTLTLSNMGEFFHMGTQWMNALNSKKVDNFLNIDFTYNLDLNETHFKKMSLFLIKKSTTTFDSLYTYPNEDFCLFKSFPHASLVMPIIIPGMQLECTCTLKYLQMYLKSVYAPKFVNITTEYKSIEDEEEKNIFLNRIPTTFLFCSKVISF